MIATITGFSSWFTSSITSSSFLPCTYLSLSLYPLWFNSVPLRVLPFTHPHANAAFWHHLFYNKGKLNRETQNPWHHPFFLSQPYSWLQLSFLFFFIILLFFLDPLHLIPLIRTVPMKCGRLFVSKEIAGVLCTEKVVFFHLNELRLISFLATIQNAPRISKLKAIHRRRRGIRRTVESEGRSRGHDQLIIIIIIGLKSPRWGLFVQNRTRVTVRWAVFHVCTSWNPSSIAVLVEAFIVEVCCFIRSSNSSYRSLAL